MAEKLAVYNHAQRLVGGTAIASLSEDREPKRNLDTAWEPAVRYCLSRGQWNFAARSIQATDVASIEPAFGHTYAFTKPDDWVRTMAVYSSESLSPDAAFLDYLDEQGYWWASMTPLFVRYVSNDVAYGFNLGKWPSGFEYYVAAHLATQIFPRHTEGAAGRMDNLLKIEKDRLKSALSEDAMNQPPAFPPTGSWVRSRGGGNSNRSRWDGMFR